MGDNVIPEPKPDWDGPNGSAEDTLGWLWPGHVYLFAVLFVILTLVAFVAIIFKPKAKQSKHFVKTIMLCAIIVLSVSRAVTLLVDPYLSNGNTSIWWTFGYILITGFGTTSLTTSLAILLYITTVSTRITSKHRQRDLGRIVCSITIVNFVFFITSDVITMLWKERGKIMLTVCQITFACWGILVSTGFGILTYKLRRNARATFEQARFNIRMKNEGDKLRKLGILLGILSVTAAIFFALRIYEAITGLTSEKYSDTWPWWAIQTVLRTLEIINAIVLLLVFHRECSKKRRIERRPNSESESGKYTMTTWKNTSVKSTTDRLMIN